MWPFTKTYSSEQWKIIDWNYIKYLDGESFDGWGIYFKLTNKKTNKQKLIQVGGPLTSYAYKWQLKNAVFKKTGIQIRPKDNGEVAEFSVS